MSKTLRSLALALSLAGVAGLAVPSALAPAQEKKKDRKATGIAELNEGKDGKFRWVVRDNDEKFLATSAAYATKDEAKKGLEALKTALENPKITEKKAEKDKDK